MIFFHVVICLPFEGLARYTVCVGFVVPVYHLCVLGLGLTSVLKSGGDRTGRSLSTAASGTRRSFGGPLAGLEKHRALDPVMLMRGRPISFPSVTLSFFPSLSLTMLSSQALLDSTLYVFIGQHWLLRETTSSCYSLTISPRSLVSVMGHGSMEVTTPPVGLSPQVVSELKEGTSCAQTPSSRARARHRRAVSTDDWLGLF